MPKLTRRQKITFAEMRSSGVLARPKDLTMRFPALFSLLLLANCATQSPLEPPVVDQRGHDPIQFQNDQLECLERGKGFMGGSITACMRERGYTILVPKN